MDDGDIITYKQTILQTRAFSKKEIIYIMEVLEKNFSLKTRFEEKEKNLIYIPVKQKIKLK